MTDLISREAAISAIDAHPAPKSVRDEFARVIRALPAAQVKVKPLVWEAVNEDGRVQDAKGFNSVYRVWLSKDGVARWQAKYMSEWNNADSLDAAKAAAQADYEARVLATLDLSPTAVDASQTPDPVLSDPRVRALVEALRLYSCEDGCNDCPEQERDRVSCGWTARAALAEIEGEK